ncbi:hypothetical protein [Streptomyces sp. B6B3]|uniref:hypothetical protein n=1 Tax=Streptomyces sp. B6B3 TaxID=3153570 RepID=UPI00325C9C00
MARITKLTGTLVVLGCAIALASGAWATGAEPHADATTARSIGVLDHGCGPLGGGIC